MMKASDISDVVVKLEEIMSVVCPADSLDVARCYVELFALRDYFVHLLNDLKYEKSNEC